MVWRPKLKHALILTAFSFPTGVLSRNLPGEKPTCKWSRAAPYPKTHIPVDIEYAGNYKLVGCSPHVAELRQLIGDAYSNLQKAIQQVNSTQNVYNAFFKDVPPSDVKSILAKVAVGNFILMGKNRYNPEIACAGPSQPRMWNACQSSHASGGYIVNTHYVYLCPVFFQDEASVPTQSDCGKIPPDMKSMWGASILGHQLTTLVNVLSRLYILQPFLRPEQFDTNSCMALPASQSRINPTNYALFVGSECYVFVSILRAHAHPANQSYRCQSRVH